MAKENTMNKIYLKNGWEIDPTKVISIDGKEITLDGGWQIGLFEEEFEDLQRELRKA